MKSLILGACIIATGIFCKPIDKTTIEKRSVTGGQACSRPYNGINYKGKYHAVLNGQINCDPTRKGEVFDPSTYDTDVDLRGFYCWFPEMKCAGDQGRCLNDECNPTEIVSQGTVTKAGKNDCPSELQHRGLSCYVPKSQGKASQEGGNPIIGQVDTEIGSLALTPVSNTNPYSSNGNEISSTPQWTTIPLNLETLPTFGTSSVPATNVDANVPTVQASTFGLPDNNFFNPITLASNPIPPTDPFNFDGTSPVPGSIPDSNALNAGTSIPNPFRFATS